MEEQLDILCMHVSIVHFISWCMCFLCLCAVQGVSVAHLHLIFMALGNPPLIRKSVSARLMLLIKKLS